MKTYSGSFTMLSTGLKIIQGAPSLADLYRSEFRAFALTLPADEFPSVPLVDREVAVANLRETAMDLLNTKRAVLRPALIRVADLLEDGHDDCIHWTGERYSNGYGSTNAVRGGRGWSKTSAHKRAFKIAVGVTIQKFFKPITSAITRRRARIARTASTFCASTPSTWRLLPPRKHPPVRRARRTECRQDALLAQSRIRRGEDANRRRRDGYTQPFL